MANEKRLIDANVAKEIIVNHANEFSDVLNRREKALLIGGGTSCIDKCPTVDAVEVVRCKDCKKWEYDENFSGWCVEWRRRTLGNHFCSYGERKDK